MTAGEKTCSKCGETKTLSEFYKDKKGRLGHQADCIECRKKSVADYAARNREQVNAKQRERARQPGVKAQRKTYLKEWYQRNREKQIVAAAQWQKENKDRVNAKSKVWRSQNPEQGTAASQRRRARLAAVATVPFTAEQLSQRWEYYGNRCYLCGEDATATDHVKPINAGGAHMLCNLRPICTPCNSTKRDIWPYAPVFERAA